MAKAPKTTTAPTGQIAPFGLRMLPELREKIEAAARESGRSMNAEVVSRLEESFTGGGDSDKVALVLSHKLSRAEVDLTFERIKNLTATYEAYIASQAAIELMEVIERKVPSINFDEKLAQRIRGINKKHLPTVEKAGPQPFDLLEKESDDALAKHINITDKLMARMLADQPLTQEDGKALVQHLKGGDASVAYEGFWQGLMKIVSGDEGTDQAPKRPKK
ncbi:Arc family DNA-binding protein [Comamonas piscis]|uniref:Arc family DNA-binding protein n=1 Tax=Comamonas piscis TaxID=1562974 RepID=A0A7G5EG64_9BURK|nr:Arc family DNA-binding protein [Comamonas piscis]QMV72989.1 Arc family DNA-binding protein [Comamonas piscis]WSO35772.1 Arc family DNA-binding protein [Comamonas piscis]